MITKKNPNPKLKLSVSCTSNGSMCILYKPENTLKQFTLESSDLELFIMQVYSTFPPNIKQKKTTIYILISMRFTRTSVL